MKQVNVALLGLGVVGSSTVNVLANNSEEISRRVGCNINLFGAAVKDPNKARDCDVKGITFFDAQTLVEHPEVDIVVELIGGTQTAKELTLKALNANKHVVTANKALIAQFGQEIFKAASQNNRMIAFEAAVAGGIPIIKTIREGLVANQISECTGIINGTCNYILTKMRDEGWSFEKALSEAQSLGFAEEDPSFDIGGIDAAHKLTILASIAFGIPLQFDKVYTQGIEGIDAIDVNFAKELGYDIKLLGIAKSTDLGIELRVHPTLIPNHTMLAGVGGAMNAVMVQANAVGPTLHYGQGAGGYPTASAVVGDLVEISRLLSTPSSRVPYLAFQDDALNDTKVLPLEDCVSGAYLRLQVADKPGMLASITQILSDKDISVRTMIQKGELTQDDSLSVVLLTHPTRWGNVIDAVKTLELLKDVQQDITCFHLETIEG